MSAINMSDAFARYKVKSPKQARSALTSHRNLVLSCFYSRFHKAEVGVLRYEEELPPGGSNTQLRTHLMDALNNELDVNLIVAMPTKAVAAADAEAVARAPRMSYHARTDLVGRVTFFDGSRFVVDFHKPETSD